MALCRYVFPDPGLVWLSRQDWNLIVNSRDRTVESAALSGSGVFGIEGCAAWYRKCFAYAVPGGGSGVLSTVDVPVDLNGLLRERPEDFE